MLRNGLQRLQLQVVLGLRSRLQNEIPCTHGVPLLINKHDSPQPISARLLQIHHAHCLRSIRPARLLTSLRILSPHDKLLRHVQYFILSWKTKVRDTVHVLLQRQEAHLSGFLPSHLPLDILGHHLHCYCVANDSCLYCSIVYF